MNHGSIYNIYFECIFKCSCVYSNAGYEHYLNNQEDSTLGYIIWLQLQQSKIKY